MSAIGYVTRDGEGFKGQLKTLTIRAPIEAKYSAMPRPITLGAILTGQAAVHQVNQLALAAPRTRWGYHRALGQIAADDVQAMAGSMRIEAVVGVDLADVNEQAFAKLRALVQPTLLAHSGCAPTAPKRHAPSSSTNEADPSWFDSHLPSWGSGLRLPRRFTGFLTTLATPLSSDPLVAVANPHRLLHRHKRC